MPSLQVRELPEHIYQKLKEAAEAEHRSLAQQAIIALAKGLDLELEPKARRQNVLSLLDGYALSVPTSELPDPVQLIQADRKR